MGKTNESKSKSFKKANKKLKKYIPLLQVLSRTTIPEIKCLINHLDEGALDQICIAVFNCLENTEFPPKEFTKLHKKILKNKNQLRFLEKNVYTRGKERRKTLVQSGGSIIALLGAILPLVISLFTKKK